MANRVQYFVELSGQTVIGCVGLLRKQKLDKIMHLSVNSIARRRGVGSRLLKAAINSSDKDVIYMTVRENNITSLTLATRAGFEIIAYKPRHDYNVLSLCLFRRKHVREKAY